MEQTRIGLACTAASFAGLAAQDERDRRGQIGGSLGRFLGEGMFARLE
jgi:hypothetical protein